MIDCVCGMIEIKAMRTEYPAAVDMERTQLLLFIEQGLAIADRLEEHDAGIWLDRARVSLRDASVERICLFAD